MADPESVLGWLTARLPSAGGVCVAFSGGPDSTALLALLAAHRQRFGGSLRALHVQHDLHPEAPAWAGHCQSVSRRLQVPLTVRSVQVTPRGEGPEAAARSARYAAFEACLGAGECLVLAHHRRDQAETVLLRLLRGAGAEGLSGMPAERSLGAGTLLRPFLDLDPEDLRAWTAGLPWLDDPSNHDPAHDRVYLRREILPRLRSRWPDTDGRLGAASERLRGARDAECRQARTDLSASFQGGRPAVSRLPDDPHRAAAALRLWIRAHGARAPDARRLAEGLAQFRAAGSDRIPELHWADGCIRRYRGRLYWVTESPTAEPVGAAVHTRPGPLREVLHAGLTAGGLRVAGVPSPGPGLAVDQACRGEDPVWWWGTRHAAPAGSLRAVKRMLQRAGLPPWWRPFLPLLWHGERPVAVPGYWIAPEWRGDPGWRIISLSGCHRGRPGTVRSSHRN